MRRRLWGVPILVGVLTVSGCGDSLAKLNRLAAAGAIHEDAPVVAHLQLEVAASPATVWALLVNAPSWPSWQHAIDSVTAGGALGSGARFSWQTGSMHIHAQVQLFEPEHRLAWTGTAFTAKAIHVWELKPEAGNRTMVIMKESMDGPWMEKMYSSQQLTESDQAWLIALKQAAER